MRGALPCVCSKFNEIAECFALAQIIVVVDEMSSFAYGTALNEGLAKKGDTIVVAAGTPIGISGTTNTLKILWV